MRSNSRRFGLLLLLVMVLGSAFWASAAGASKANPPLLVAPNTTYVFAPGATLEFQIANEGGGSTGAITVTLTGDPQFSIVNDGCSGIALNQSHPVCIVTFHYDGTAQAAATLTVASPSQSITGQFIGSP